MKTNYKSIFCEKCRDTFIIKLPASKEDEVAKSYFIVKHLHLEDNEDDEK